jgi:hypothetical protein
LADTSVISPESSSCAEARNRQAPQLSSAVVRLAPAAVSYRAVRLSS